MITGEWGEFPDFPSFVEDAACASVDPELFFPERGDGDGQYGRQIAEAKRICRTCPVREECLQYALDIEGTVDARFGIFGGLTHAERRRLARGLSGVA